MCASIGVAGHYTTWVLPSEMTCNLHILVMSGELATGVDLYTLIARVQFSETGTALDIMEPCYKEPCMSSPTPRTQSEITNPFSHNLMLCDLALPVISSTNTYWYMLALFMPYYGLLSRDIHILVHRWIDKCLFSLLQISMKRKIIKMYWNYVLVI